MTFAVTLTAAEVSQLQVLIRMNQEDGGFQGETREAWDERNAALLEKLGNPARRRSG
jgi:hypothetical protein